MYDIKRVSRTIGGREITLETGKLARQADGAVVISCGESVVLVTVVASETVREGIDFFPLTVDVEERMYAAGKIPGGFFRREGRPTEKAILTARLTDRPIRPSFPDWFRHDTQIIATILQVDNENPHDVHCITGASAAMLVGGLPFAGPISGVRLGHIHGRWVVFPTFQELEQATIELVVAGRVSGEDVEILMIEAGAFEHTLDLVARGAPPPTEEVLADGLDASKEYIRQLCRAQQALAAQVEVPQREWIRCTDYEQDVWDRVVELADSRLQEAFGIVGKAERNDALRAVEREVAEKLAAEFPEREREVLAALRALEKKIVRRQILSEGRRIGGRGPKDLRPLHAEVGLLGRTHGSGLFQRGETQVLSVCTLGMLRMEQVLDTIFPEESKRYMHHYQFPPFSTGETGRLGPSRRAIGHGALAEKAVLPIVPPEEEFPYAIRVVSEVLESNGSTSMASACASTLALMDAGVPVKDMVGGIAMGLVAEGGRYVTLTDIIGTEDNFGDMDFKVAGTENVVTALQLDTKTTGIPTDVLRQALQQAREARLEVLRVMRQAIDRPRPELSPYAPRVIVETIPVDKIGEVIGPKGKTINEIVARYDVQIDIEDDGRVFIAARDQAAAARALQEIRDIAFPRQLAVGDVFEGTVVKTTEFGAFVSLVPGRDGLVHISKLGRGKRVKKVEDVVSVGDKIWVRINEIRPDGKLSLVPLDEPPGSRPGREGQAAELVGADEG